MNRCSGIRNVLNTSVDTKFKQTKIQTEHISSHTENLDFCCREGEMQVRWRLARMLSQPCALIFLDVNNYPNTVPCRAWVDHCMRTGQLQIIVSHIWMECMTLNQSIHWLKNSLWTLSIYPEEVIVISRASGCDIHSSSTWTVLQLYICYQSTKDICG